jgi:hypothetical protein
VEFVKFDGTNSSLKFLAGPGMGKKQDEWEYGRKNILHLYRNKFALL